MSCKKKRGKKYSVSNEVNRKEPKKLHNLLMYYVNRYHLPQCSDLDPTAPLQEQYRSFGVEIRRILQRTRIAGYSSLWEKNVSEGSPYKISIDEFEEHCFEEWERYIKAHCAGKYDHVQLEADARENKRRKEYRDLDKAIEDNIQMSEEYEDMINKDFDDKPQEPIVTEQELRKKGIDMMVEAIYAVFYEAFNWDELASDMKKSWIPFEGNNPDVTQETVEAIQKLRDYTNYVGKRKDK